MTQTKTARLVARNGIFDQTNEEYMVIDANGLDCLDDWTPLFSTAADEYEKITGESIDSAECQMVIHEPGGHPEEVYEFEAIHGDDSEGVAILDGYAYQFDGGSATRRSIDAEWDSVGGDYRFRVVPNGDGTTWRKVEDGN